MIGVRLQRALRGPISTGGGVSVINGGCGSSQIRQEIAAESKGRRAFGEDAAQGQDRLHSLPSGINIAEPIRSLQARKVRLRA